MDNLHFSYEDQPVLQDVNLTVEAGEAVAVMGRNGAGKSTLLKCVVGLLQAERGEVVVNGRSTHTSVPWPTFAVKWPICPKTQMICCLLIRLRRSWQ